MRPVIVAGVGGLLLGHILWLLLISMAAASSATSTWVLLISLVVIGAAAVSGRRSWRRYQDKDFARAAFLGALPVSPVLFTLIVLGQTYL